MGPWTQLWVTGANTTPQSMKRVDEHLQTMGAFMHAPSLPGVPVAEADGSYEVRVLFGNPGFVKFVLTDHYGLTIVREQVNEE